MTGIAPISPIAPEILGDLPPVMGPRAPETTSSFGDLFTQGLARVNDSLVTSQADMQALATGEVQNLHQVMIRLEESRISFQLMMQVRNRLLEAYQEVMRMQI